MKTEFQLIIVCGRNSKLKRRLEKRKGRLKKKVLILEYVDNINELMSIASLIITKPGGLTTAEALSKNLPMLLVNHIPGQEENNTKFLLKAGVAIRAKQEEDIPILVTELLCSKNKLNQMREQAKGLGKPSSTIDLVRFILHLL